MVQLPILTNFYPKKGHLEFSGAFFLAEIFEKVSFDPEQMKNFYGMKICLYLPFKY